MRLTKGEQHAAGPTDEGEPAVKNTIVLRPGRVSVLSCRRALLGYGLPLLFVPVCVLAALTLESWSIPLAETISAQPLVDNR